ncbi:hypothetical protein K1719_007145 [Acacia pycnantha]|nr:hypothetical protein K1719_007145 [Acacia pycnantha]
MLLHSTEARRSIPLWLFPASVNEVPATRSIEKRGLEKEEIEWREEEEGEGERRETGGWKAYFEYSKELIKSDGGPSRWFSPLCGGSWLNNSPLLLFLPGRATVRSKRINAITKMSHNQ